MNFAEFKYRIQQLSEIQKDNHLEIERVIIDYFGNLGSIKYLFPYQYVVRASLNADGEIFSNIKRCSYNPHESAIVLQRCNYPGQQVFYCSMYSETDEASTSMTCLMETARETVENNIQRKIFTLSRWDLKRQLDLFILPFSGISCERNRDFKKFRDEVRRQIQANENYHEITDAFTYLSNLFCSSINKSTIYKICAAYFNALLHFEQLDSKCSFDGLIYPSANTEGAGMNVVLKREIVDSNIIHCTHASMYLMKRDPHDFNSLSFMPASYVARPGLDGSFHFNLLKEDLRKYEGE